MPFTLEVLGGARIVDSEGEVVEGRAVQRRRLGLLTLLAAAPDVRLPRDKILVKLWPDAAESKARAILSQAIFEINRRLKADVFSTSGDEIQLARAVLRCDLTEFREAVAAGDLRRAAKLYRGPFLDGFSIPDARDFEDWADLVRLEVAGRYSAALTALAEQASAAGDHADAEEWWMRLTTHAPDNAAARLGLMRTLAARGERLRAIGVARTYVVQMEGLDIEPDPRVMELADRLRAEPATPDTARPAPPAPPDPRGPGLGLPAEFRVIRQIGEGSMAHVYLAHEAGPERLVAVKILKPQLEATARLRFQREAQAAGRIFDPNVAMVLRVGTTDAGVPYIVFPYIAGGSLADRLLGAGPLSILDARRYVRQVALGLAAAHRLRIVHRDVRPANILHDREANRVLLTDFGLAAVVEAVTNAQMRLTVPGEPLGIPGYASPEQLQCEPITERTDVYSLGIVAFELLTGRLPFDARTAAEMTVAHVRETPHRVAELRPEVDPALDDLIQRCLRKLPEHRPFAADVANALG